METVAPTYENRILLDRNSAVLTIKQATYEDSGNYDQEITVNKKVYHNAYKIEVIDKVSKPNISCEMIDTYQATLVCSTESKHSPLLKFKWRSGGNEQTGPNVTITLRKFLNHQVYICEVSNPLTIEMATFTAKDCLSAKLTVAEMVVIITSIVVFIGLCIILGLYKKRQELEREQLRRKERERDQGIREELEREQLRRKERERDQGIREDCYAGEDSVMEGFNFKHHRWLHTCTPWKFCFADLRELGQFTGKDLDKKLIQFCFLHIIQDQLKEFVGKFNRNILRSQRDGPAEDKLQTVLPEDIDECRRRWCTPREQYPCDETLFKHWELIRTENGWKAPVDKLTAFNLYLKLRKKTYEDDEVVMETSIDEEEQVAGLLE
nr:uncharacterized protein LOC133603054 [Nerophis lumbriciformis]